MEFYTKLNTSLERTFVLPDQVYLDISNPRFFGERKFDLSAKFDENEVSIDNPKVQEYTRQFLEQKYNIQEIVKSIKKVGFLKLDRIIVKPFKDDNMSLLKVTGV